MKLLFVSIELPFPPTSGGRIKSWNMLKAFTANYDVTLVCPLKYGDGELEKFNESIQLDNSYHEKVERERTPKNLITSYLSGVPINVYRSASKKLKAQVERIIDEFDVVVLDHYESFYYLPDNCSGKVIFHTHNATYLMWQRYANGDDSFVMRSIAAFEARRVKKYEKSACDHADLVFAAPNDIEYLCLLGCDPTKFRETYHLGDDSQLALPQLQLEGTREQLLYVGTLTWEANVDGLLWFLDEVWPDLKAQRPRLSFHIAGGKPDKRLVNKVETCSDVSLLGFVEDLESHFKESRLFISPLRFGAGIKVKVLNTMCRGLPVVTTSVGAEGLGVEHMRDIAIADNAQETIIAINTLLDDSDSWHRIRDGSRRIIEAKYTWKRVLGYMLNEIQHCLGSKK